MKKSKKILLSLTGLAAFATLPIAAISCQTPTKQDEPKKEDVKTEEPKKEDIKADKSNDEALVAKVNEKAKALAVASNFTFKLGSKFTNSTLSTALEEQGAKLAYSFSAHNLALYKDKPVWNEAPQRQVFEIKTFDWKLEKKNFQIAHPDSPTYSSNGKTKINSEVKFTIDKANKTITIQFKGALFIANKDPLIGTETVSVTLPIELEEARTEEGTDKANPGTVTPGSAGTTNTPQGGDSAQENPQTGNQGSTGAQAGGTDNQAQATPNGSTGTTDSAQGSETAQSSPSTNAQGSGSQAGAGTAENGTSAGTSNESGSAGTSTDGSGTTSTTPSSTSGASGQSSARSEESSESSTAGSQEGGANQLGASSGSSSTPASASSSTDQASGEASSASTQS